MLCPSERPQKSSAWCKNKINIHHVRLVSENYVLCRARVCHTAIRTHKHSCAGTLYVQWIMYFIYLHTMRLHHSYTIYLFVCLKMKRDTYRDKYTLAHKRIYDLPKRLYRKRKYTAIRLFLWHFFIFISGTEANVKRKPEQWRKHKEWSEHTQMILLRRKKKLKTTVYVYTFFSCCFASFSVPACTHTHTRTIARAEISFFFWFASVSKLDAIFILFCIFFLLSLSSSSDPSQFRFIHFQSAHEIDAIKNARTDHWFMCARGAHKSVRIEHPVWMACTKCDTIRYT